MHLSLVWLVVHLSLACSLAQPGCEDSLPAGYSLGGAVFLNRDCAWRPQVHFVSSLTGKLATQNSPLDMPVVTLVSSDIPTSTSGANRLAVSDVVLANFSLTDPTTGPVLWPVGLVAPGLQPGSSLPRRLYLQDMQMLVNSSSLQQYLRFFRNASTPVYTDNATFLHIPFWADEITLASNVGLLLEVPGLDVTGYAGSKPAAGRNFVIAADQSTLVRLLQDVASASTSLPFLINLSANVSLGLGVFAAGLPINRPMYVVGRSLVPTSIDFGMQVNQLVMLGTWSHLTLSRVVLENLAPGNARTLAFAGPNDVLMSYNVWPLLYSRTVNRMALHNCTLVLSPLEVEEYLYRATLFKVQPAGFEQQLAVLDANVVQWQVVWFADSHSVQTHFMQTESMTVLDCNYTDRAQVVARLPVPARTNDTSLYVAGASFDYAITHVDESGVLDIGTGAYAAGSSEIVLLTTNMSFGSNLPKSAVPELQFIEHLSRHSQESNQLKHIVMGIVDPPVELDLGYSTDLIRLPADGAAGHITLINVVALQLSQGAAAEQPGANIMTPEIWTHLLWSIPRSRQGTSVWLSNVTLWVPAAEFSYIRSHTSEALTNFTIPLNGAQSIQFFNVRDLGAEGLYIEHYLGPGLEAFSLRIKLETGWSQDGPPGGFWSSSGNTDSSRSGKLSDAVVVVLSVCLVTAVVASVLACLAFVLWRKRSAEARAAAVLAAAELSKAGLAGTAVAGAGSGPSGGSGGQSSNHNSNRRNGNGDAVRFNTALLEAPVHDSSDSYPLQDRALLTAELARSQFTGNRLSQGDGVGTLEPGTAGRYQLQTAAANVGLSANSVASDACLQRLHSAITTMSQDVLSRRLQGSIGKLSVPGSERPGGGPALGRPSLLGGDVGSSPHAQQQFTPRHLQQLRQDAAGGHCSGSHAVSTASSQSLTGAEAAAAGAVSAAAAAGVDQDEQLASSAGAAAGPGVGSGAGSLASLSTPGTLGELKLLQLVGQGTFGQVYKALWRRRCVAVKVLQLPATAGSSDVSPWVGVGRVGSHREKMAVMETVVSTTMSHPNIVQVYTYVLQPLLSGQGRLTSSNGKGQANGMDSSDDKQQQLRPQLQPQQEQQQKQEQQQQQGRDMIQQQQQQQQQQQVVPVFQPQAAFLLAQQQQQQQQNQLPDVQQVPDHAAASANVLCQPSPEQQQQHPQQQGADSPSAATNISGYHRLNGSMHASCNDSSQSLVSVQHLAMGKLTPEMAAAAAAALPAAAAAAAGGATAAGGFVADSTSSSGNDGASSDDGAGGPPRQVLVGWELQLVMEFCDAGSLRTALDHKLLIDRTTGLPALECVLFLAHDVACAMIHLHSEHLLHGDLKASNVLLKRTAPRLPVSPEQAAAAAAGGSSSSSNTRRGHGQLMGLGLGLMAKVADFGLSLTLGPADTHVSQMHMGTLTHMAPELLLHGRASKASDVYAYGIMLWELATGRRPYSGTPVGMLAHKVVQQGWRPAWPGGCCQPVQALAEACWCQEAAARPCFEEIVQQLEDMASQLDVLKQQQAQQMAAAAAPLCHTGTGNHEVELGHELTPSMMEELMPSGFSGGSDGSGDRHVADCGILYEMSQLSCSQDREVILQQLPQLQEEEEEEEEVQQGQQQCRESFAQQQVQDL